MTENHTTQKHREWVTVTLTEMKGNIGHIREMTDAQEKHLSKLNDRIGKAENKVSTIQGIGSVFAVMFSGLFGYFFTKN